MPNSGDSAKKRGRPPAGKERTRRNTLATKKAAEGGVPAAAGTIERAETYKGIYAGSRKGRNVESLAEEYELSQRRVTEILDELKAARIEELRVDDPWAGHSFDDDMMVWLREVLSDAAEIYSDAKGSGNLSSATGALKIRTKALAELAIFLEDTGRVPRRTRQVEEPGEADLLVIIGNLFKESHIRYELFDELVRRLESKIGPERVARLLAAGPPARWPRTGGKEQYFSGPDYYNPDGTLTPRGEQRLAEIRREKDEEASWGFDVPGPFARRE